MAFRLVSISRNVVKKLTATSITTSSVKSINNLSSFSVSLQKMKFAGDSKPESPLWSLLMTKKDKKLYNDWENDNKKYKVKIPLVKHSNVVLGRLIGVALGFWVTWRLLHDFSKWTGPSFNVSTDGDNPSGSHHDDHGRH